MGDVLSLSDERTHSPQQASSEDQVLSLDIRWTTNKWRVYERWPAKYDMICMMIKAKSN